jgi:DNA topoisomerase-1
MRTLLIVESPAKAKTIQKYLGRDFKVMASVGHVRDLPKSNKKAIDIEGGFVPHYEVVKGKEKVMHEISEAAEDADKVLLATDPDREGEAIAWHIAELLKKSKKVAKKDIKRVRFNEITKEAIFEALQKPDVIHEDLRAAQEARRVLDRLVGYDLSGLIWKKVRYGLSAGRVQSPALRIIMEREREIRAFVPENFWVITANVENKNGPFTLACVEEPRDKGEVDRILEAGNKGPWKVRDITESEMNRAPRAPFTTSTLQQSASTRLGFSPSRTMSVAQRLYEAGLITYMRTDSTTLSGGAISSISKFVENEYGKNYLEVRQYKTKSKNAQEAHEAIRPTDVTNLKAGANEEQQRLYRLIWARTVSSQMAAAKVLKSKVLVEVANGSVPDFSVNGSRVLFDGWLKVDTGARGEDIEIPKVEKGESLTLKDINAEGKQTEPPNRYSEAGLIKELEKRGIGRPSTYASIMRTIEARGYVEKIGKALKPTDTGDVVSTFLEDNFPTYISDSFTAEMEDELDEIAEGKREYVKTLSDFYKPFLKDIKEKDKKIAKLTTLGDAPKEFDCPKCKSGMVFKLSRNGKFMSCSRFPDCDGARTETGLEVKPDEPIGVYPPTGESIFVLNGRFGPYVQVGEMVKGKKSTKGVKPRRASIPKEKDPTTLTLEDALKYLALPRELGTHPESGKMISSNVGRFGPYVVHDGDFRSLKTDDVYTIELPRALEIFKEEKKTRRGGFRKKQAEQ